HVQIRQGLLDRAAEVDIEVTGEGRMDSALQADLGAAPLPGLLAAADDLVERDEVRCAAQVRGEFALRECAEAAAEVADVRVVDVAGDDVGDRVAADLAPERVGGRDDRGEVTAAGPEELGDVVLVELDLLAHLGQRLGGRRRDRRQVRSGRSLGHFRRRAVSQVYGFARYARRGEEAGCAFKERGGPDRRAFRTLARARGPVVFTGEAVCVGEREHARRYRRVD